MNRVRMERRSFLKAVAQTLVAAPVVPLLGRLAEAQEPTEIQHPVRSVVSKSHIVAEKPAVVLNVRDFGATGDGKTKDTLLRFSRRSSAARCSAAAKWWWLRATI